MGFASMNGVIAGRGMRGTARQGSASFSAPHLQNGAPPAPQGPPPVPVGSSYTHGAGMQMTGRAPAPAGPVQQPRLNPGASISNEMSNMASIVNQPNEQGVVAGQTTPSAVGPQQNPQFDPNDPNNAALAGYQMAR